MKTFFILLFLIVALGAVFFFLYETGFLRKFFESNSVAEEPGSKFPFRRKDYLLSVAERNFFGVLEQVATEMGFYLFVKVRLEDLLWLPSGTESRFAFRNRVKSRHVDFVLCEKKDIRPLLVLELDDSSHQRQDRMERDEMVDKILHDAGLPVLHVRTKSFYEASSVQEEIRTVLTNHSFSQ